MSEKIPKLGEDKELLDVNDPAFEQFKQKIEEEKAEDVQKDTRREWKEKLKGLVGKVYEKGGILAEKGKEKIGFSEKMDFLKQRSKEIDDKAKAEYGSGAERYLRLVADRYNKLNWKYKVAVGAGLGIGAAAFSTVSGSLATIFGTGIAVQRALGMGGMFLKFEKHLQDTGEGKRSGFFARQEWYQKLSSRPETQRKMMSALMSVAYSGAMSAAMYEGVHLLSQSSWGEAVHEWLKNHYPFSNGSRPAAPMPRPLPGAEAVKIPEISVEATPGRGYEYMLKRAWEQLQDKHLDPTKYAEGSDIRRLLETSKDSIDGEAHRIAMDAKHGFFNLKTGESVQINLGEHLSFDANGDIQISDHAPTVRAPAGEKVTPPYNPEIPKIPSESVGIADNAEQYNFDPYSRADSSVPAESETKYDVPTAPISHPDDLPIPRAENQDAIVHVDMDDLPQQVEVPSLPEIHESIVNKFGIEIIRNEPHFYADGAEHVFAYGGSPEKLADAIQEFLIENPDKTVYSADAHGKYRIPWCLINGEAMPEAPVQTNGFLGFFRSFMEAPQTDEFEKIIK